MKTIGIIAEFNPFHQGHRYLIDEAVKETGAECVVSVMSGSFTQRGMPAVYDKWRRAEAALENGVSLVLELPAVYSCNSAEYFARGGVKVLEGLGAVDKLVFGSEEGNLDKMIQCAELLKNEEESITESIREKIKEGYSYPKARETALEELGLCSNLGFIREPNNILGIEYLKWLDKMEPFTIKRQGKGHHSSASELRAEIRRKEPEVLEIPEKNYFNLVRAKILQSEDEELEKVFSAGAGLGLKMKKEIRYATDIDDFAERVKSKAYTRTRINRMLTHTLLGINRQVMEKAVPYARVLGFDATGSKLLKKIKKEESASIPVITNINKEAYLYPEIKDTLSVDILATDLYNLITEKDLYQNSDYVRQPVRMRR